MPAVKKGVMGADETLVKISEMPDWAQVAFEGYKWGLLAYDADVQPSCAQFVWSLQPGNLSKAKLEAFRPIMNLSPDKVVVMQDAQPYPEQNLSHCIWQQRECAGVCSHGSRKDQHCHDVRAARDRRQHAGRHDSGMPPLTTLATKRPAIVQPVHLGVWLV